MHRPTTPPCTSRPMGGFSVTSSTLAPSGGLTSSDIRAQPSNHLGNTRTTISPDRRPGCAPLYGAATGSIWPFFESSRFRAGSSTYAEVYWYDPTETTARGTVRWALLTFDCGRATSTVARRNGLRRLDDHQLRTGGSLTTGASGGIPRKSGIFLAGTTGPTGSLAALAVSLPSRTGLAGIAAGSRRDPAYPGSAGRRRIEADGSRREVGSSADTARNICSVSRVCSTNGAYAAGTAGPFAGAREHNLKNITLPCRATAGRHHRPVRIGQEQPRLRHDYAEGRDACREAVAYARTVPRRDAEAGCRPDRRLEPGGSRSTRRAPAGTRVRLSAR